MDNNKINIDFELIIVQGVHVKTEEYMNKRLEKENSNFQILFNQLSSSVPQFIVIRAFGFFQR
jgi:hypothetical protein